MRDYRYQTSRSQSSPPSKSSAPASVAMQGASPREPTRASLEATQLSGSRGNSGSRVMSSLLCWSRGRWQAHAGPQRHYQPRFRFFTTQIHIYFRIHYDSGFIEIHKYGGDGCAVRWSTPPRRRLRGDTPVLMPSATSERLRQHDDAAGCGKGRTVHRGGSDDIS